MKGIRARYIAMTAAMLLGAVLTTPTMAGGAIVVRGDVEVADRSALLRDVLDLSALPRDEAETLGEKEFCVAPPPAKEIVLNDKQIKGKLYNAGLDLENYELQIPEKMTIKRLATIVTGTSVVEGAAAYLYKALPWDGLLVETDSSRAPQDIVLPKGDVKVEYAVEVDSSKYGIQNFHATVYRDGEKVRVVGLTSYVRAMGKVVVAARDLKPNETLTEEDFEYGSTDLSRLRTGVFRDVSELAGKQAARPVRAGDMITKSMVDLPPDIKSGDMIKLVIKAPGLEITGEGKALHDGYIGESTKVLNTQTKKIIYGVVVDQSTVEITGP